MKRLARALAFAWSVPTVVIAADGEIWVWTAADGSIHYTDERERIPERYREQARIAHEEGGGSYQQIPALPPKNERAPAAPAPDPAEAPPEATDPEAAAEAAWREQARAIDARIAALAPQAAACANDHVNRSPGDGSRKRRQELEEAERCAAAKRDLASARAEREALEERAHRAGAPPGWVRPAE
jgi:hypothetical protein